MGFNTVAVILNDHTDRVKNDPSAGQKIHSAVLKEASRPWLSLSGRFDNHAGYGIEVVSSAHADQSQLVLVRHNWGCVLWPPRANYDSEGHATTPDKHHQEALEFAIDIVKQYGYVVYKKAKRKA